LIALDGSFATDEVHDDRDQRNDKQQMDQKAANVQDEESAKPKQNQHHSQNEKHEAPAFFERNLPQRTRAISGHMS
jgi:hypothetical protein